MLIPFLATKCPMNNFNSIRTTTFDYNSMTLVVFRISLLDETDYTLVFASYLAKVITFIIVLLCTTQKNCGIILNYALKCLVFSPL